MNVLYIATSFPEPEKGATIYTDLAEALNEAGHVITVVVSEQRRNLKKTVLGTERGFRVLRIVTGNYYDVSVIEKGISTLIYPQLMKNGIKRFLCREKFDLILFEAPPVTNSSLVAWAKKTFGCPSYLMMKDIFPQNALDLGIFKEGGSIHRYFSKLERLLYKTADTIGCMSQANIEYIKSHNEWLDSGKLELFPNTKRLEKFQGMNYRTALRRLGISDDRKVFLFGGNMGKPQYINLLCEIVKEFKDDKRTFFLFIGHGTDRYKLQRTIEDAKIKNTLLLENLPRDEYEELAREADIGMIVLDPRFTIPNFPSRILTYMEHAKPVLALTDKITDIRRMIEESGCGEWAWSGDRKQVLAKVRSMISSDNLKEMGLSGRRYAEEHYDVRFSIEALERRHGAQKER